MTDDDPMSRYDSGPTSFNDKIIAEFHDNNGVLGGMFAGGDMLLLHHVGRKSGKEHIAPLAWFAGSPGTVYVAASAAGAPKHPQWYANLLAAGRTTIEVGRGDGVGGIDTHEVTVEDLQGAERDRVWAELVAKSPGFGDYERKTDGIRTIPVLALHRVG